MELWDVYNADRIKQDKTMERGSAFESGAYHLAVHVCIFNLKGEMLIQQRQTFKTEFPDMWDVTAAGSAIAGETSQEAIHRELFEELGLEIDFKNIRPHLTVNFDKGFDDFYLLEKEVNTEALFLQKEEVKQVKWASIDEINEKLDNGTFVPFYKSIIKLLFDMRKSYGSYKPQICDRR